MVEEPSNANNASEEQFMENATSNANEDASKTLDPNGAGKKQVKGSSCGKRQGRCCSLGGRKFCRVHEMVWRSHDHHPLKRPLTKFDQRT